MVVLCPWKCMKYSSTKQVLINDVWPWMETFGCSFFVHSCWVSGSNNSGVGAIGTAEFCMKTVGRTRSRRRPAVDEGTGSCEDAVMVTTSPLTAKVGLWDTAGERERKLQHVNAKFLHLASKKKKLFLSHFKNHSFPQTFNSWGLSALNSAQKSYIRMKK